MSHVIFYENEKGFMVGILEWRSRPLDARRAIRIFDLLKRDHNVVIRYEDSVPVEMKNGLQEGPGNSNYTRDRVHPHHYEDGSAHMKEWQ